MCFYNKHDIGISVLKPFSYSLVIVAKTTELPWHLKNEDRRNLLELYTARQKALLKKLLRINFYEYIKPVTYLSNAATLYPDNRQYKF